MNMYKRWFVVFIVLALITGFVPGVFAQSLTEPAPLPQRTEPAMDMPIMDRPAPDGPVSGGQDIIEPGVTPMMSREEALQIAKQALLDHMKVDVDRRNFQLNTEYRRDWHQPDRYIWNLYWYLSEPMEYANASVTLDAGSGQILDMNQDSGSYSDPQRRLLTLTREEAQQMAEAFIETLIPGKLDSMQLRETPEQYQIMPTMPIQYMFNYVRVINGAVYDANFVNVGIDGGNGEIKYYNQRWEESPEVPSLTGIIDSAAARRLFLADMQAELFYLPLRNEFMYEAMPKDFRLAYRINPSMIYMIDAHSGEPVDWSGRENDVTMKEKDLTAAQKAAIAARAETVTVREQPMTQQEAEALAREFVLGFIGETIEIQSANYIEGDQYWESAGRRAWNIDFMTAAEEQDDVTKPDAMRMPPYMNGRVMINAMTGELITFNWWQFYEGYPPADNEIMLTWEEGYDAAIEAIAKHHPQRIEQIRTLQRSIQQVTVMDGRIDQVREYAYHFPRVINGIVLDDNHLAVGVNAQTGLVTSYTDRWSDALTLPRADEVVPEDRALQTLLQNFRLELAYFRYNQNDDYVNPDYAVRLVYRWIPRESTASFPYIDAVTGVALDYNGRAVPERDAAGFEAGISGHWVERTAKLLAQQGIIDTVGFSPDEPISRMEAIKMMVKARGTDYYGPMRDMGGEKVQFIDVVEHDEDYRYIQWAIRYDIIDNMPEEFDREATVSREEMAFLLVRFMGYKQLAETTGIFRVEFTDGAQISESHLGSVAINLGLGIISGGRRDFRPQAETTMAETAQMLFKAVAQQRR
jgi:hypothetical protein